MGNKKPVEQSEAEGLMRHVTTTLDRLDTITFKAMKVSANTDGVPWAFAMTFDAGLVGLHNSYRSMISDYHERLEALGASSETKPSRGEIVRDGDNFKVTYSSSITPDPKKDNDQ